MNALKFYGHKKVLLQALEQAAADLLRWEENAECPDEGDKDLFAEWGSQADALFHAVNASWQDARYADVMKNVRCELESATYGAMMTLVDELDITHDEANKKVKEVLNRVF